MRTELRLCGLLLAGIAAMGCAYGNTHTFDYRPVLREALGGGERVVLFAVDERRKESVEEGEPATWVGEQRGGYGNPFDLRTTGGRPFAEEVVEWEFEATVLGPDGEEAESHRIEGRKTLQGSVINPPRAATEKVPPFSYELMHELVAGNADVVRALVSG